MKHFYIILMIEDPDLNVHLITFALLGGGDYIDPKYNRKIYTPIKIL